MTLEAVLDKFGAKPNGSQWVARCPAHADKGPSLSLAAKNGKLLVHCFAGCTLEAICAAAGIKVRDLFSEPRAPRRPEPRIVRDVQEQIADLRSRLTPRDRERSVTVVVASEANLDEAIARALALAVEGELVQIVFGEEAT